MTSDCYDPSETDIQILKDIKILFIGFNTRREEWNSIDNPILLQMLGTLSWAACRGKTSLIRANHAAQFLSVERFTSILVLRALIVEENNPINHIYCQAKECLREKMLLCFEIKIDTQTVPSGNSFRLLHQNLLAELTSQPRAAGLIAKL